MDKKTMEINNVGNNNKSLIHLAISFRKLCIATACLPLVTLLICFVTAYIFQQDDIHETHCRVYNVLPSISAITGVSPQRYLWRVTIALHIGPRLVIATVYHSYYRKILTDLEDLPKKLIGCRLLNLCFWLNIIEIAALCGSLIHLAISFRKLCIATACLPLVTLLICFVTAYIFQQDDIHETHCRVYNVLPSISAITGVSPQRYLWRVTIALHIGPRLVIATVYHSYYRKILTDLEDLPKKLIGCRLLNLCFWLNIIEIAALCGMLMKKSL
ncbi:Similar to CG7990: Post-GPI attachment to proteins factor 2-like (Drosophila melanogaster) [Cotesia congregata]|uniref:Similar to CG7990: Post-GPI attachment to proteins factor 2-like (Drosophila melanogaster) n=1 Tax=Cotesia congregata TaxID=51543 RepID=A0A8J2H6M9_COTCN|nr:Similar to CG7990: Post-GPI attachment to proteins factor 2-like (Drosophila melanogaster) [Cotesia congregata]